MKLMTIASGGRFCPSVLTGEHVLNLITAREVISLAECVPDTMTGLLRSGPEGLKIIARVAALARERPAFELLRNAGALNVFKDVVLGPVVPEPDLVLSGSMNSYGHLQEMGDEVPVFPCAFHKVRSALTGSGSMILAPAGHENMIDWEGEFCVVMGATCHQVSEADALDYVVGYTLMNDVSARDFAKPFITASKPSPTAQAWERNVLGKNYPTFAPIGPVIATKDEFADPFSYRMETIVNGEVMQSSTQEDLVFGPAQMIAYFSQFYVFQPGDIISMGSPPGVGMARKPPRFLESGDSVEVRVKEIGSLINQMHVR